MFTWLAQTNRIGGERAVPICLRNSLTWLLTSAEVSSNWETTWLVSVARAMVRGAEVGCIVGKGSGFRQTGDATSSEVEDHRRKFVKKEEREERREKGEWRWMMGWSLASRTSWASYFALVSVAWPGGAQSSDGWCRDHQRCAGEIRRVPRPKPRCTIGRSNQA